MRIIIECPERILHLEAGYIYADCPFVQLQPSCSPAADHTLSTVDGTYAPCGLCPYKVLLSNKARPPRRQAAAGRDAFIIVRGRATNLWYFSFDSSEPIVVLPERCCL